MTKEVKSEEDSKVTLDKKSDEATSSEESLARGSALGDPELADVSTEVDTEGFDRLKTIADDELPPVFINGEPHAIINEKYVPYKKAQLIFIDKQIERLKRKRRVLEYEHEREKQVQEQAEREINEKKRKMEEERKKKEKEHLKEKKRIEQKLKKR